MRVPGAANDNEGILDSADIYLARMVWVPCGANMFIDGRFAVYLIFRNHIMSIDLQRGIFISADLCGQCYTPPHTRLSLTHAWLRQHHIVLADPKPSFATTLYFSLMTSPKVIG